MGHFTGGHYSRISATPTFLNDLSLLIQHPLDLAAPHVRQPHLWYEGLGPVKLLSQGHLSLHCHQEAHIVLAETWADGARTSIQRKCLSTYRDATPRPASQATPPPRPPRCQPLRPPRPLSSPLPASQTTPPPCPLRCQPLRPPRPPSLPASQTTPPPVLPAASLSDHPAPLSSHSERVCIPSHSYFTVSPTVSSTAMSALTLEGRFSPTLGFPTWEEEGGEGRGWPQAIDPPTRTYLYDCK